MKALLPVLTLVLTSQLTFGADQRSAKLLHQAIEAQGGEEKLRALESIRWKAHGYRNLLEQSERPEGPYFADFFTSEELHDLKGHRFRRQAESTVFPLYRYSSTTVVSQDAAMTISGGHKLPGHHDESQIRQEEMALSPERLLLTALDAPDTHLEPDAPLQSLSQHVVAFTLDGAPVRLYLNPYTALPTGVDYSGPLARSGYWSFLGADVTMRISYGFWWLAKDGIAFPMQWNIETNGLPDQMVSIEKLDLHASYDAADLEIPDEIRSRFQENASYGDPQHIPLGNPKDPAKEIAPGIVFIPGSWNVTMIRQQDGILILEAPISSGYSAQVLTEAHKRFPGVPVKGVITTSDSWPHLAGIREYVANEIPIYALDLNQPILKRVLTMPRTSKPDHLQQAPHQAQFHLVSGKTLLGQGDNRIEIYPLRGETSERQMMVYFPEHKLLYGSDPFQKGPDGTYFYPQTVKELMDAVAREHLEVRDFFMMHVGLTPWNELSTVIRSAEAKESPDGILP